MPSYTNHEKAVLFHPHREQHDRTLAVEIKFLCDQLAKTHGAHIGKCLRERKWSDLELPDEIKSLEASLKKTANANDELLLTKFKTRFGKHISDESDQKSRWQRVFYQVKLSMSVILADEIERHNTYAAIETKQDPGELLGLIELIASGENVLTSKNLQRLDVTSKLLNFKQPSEMSDLQYTRELEHLFGLVKQRGVQLFDKKDETRGLCALALRNADNSRHAELKEHLRRTAAGNVAYGKDPNEAYPDNMSDLLRIMQEFRTQQGVAVGTGVSFTQVAGEFSVYNMTMTPTISSQTHGIPRSWICVDSGATQHVFCNKDFINGLTTDTTSVLHIHCNAGKSTTQRYGTGFGVLQKAGRIWYQPDGIANVLSLSELRKVYDIKLEDRGFILTSSGIELVFKERACGLFAMDVSLITCLTIASVKVNSANYSKEDCRRAKAVRDLQHKLGHPDDKTFGAALDNSKILNCPYTSRDIHNAKTIFGPCPISLKGKATHRSGRSASSSIVQVPPTILQRYGQIGLFSDVMYVSGLAFVLTISSDLRCYSVAPAYGPGGRSGRNLSAIIQSTIEKYHQRGFRVVRFEADNQFNYVQDRLEGVVSSICAAGAHVPQAERAVRTVKERCRCLTNQLPFHFLPRTLIVELVRTAVFWLNAIPPNNGVSATITPHEIMTGHKLDFNTDACLKFGEYVHVHNGTTNTMCSRTGGALVVRPIGTSRGAWLCYSLLTGKLIRRHSWTSLPIDDIIVNRVHDLAKLNGSVDHPDGYDPTDLDLNVGNDYNYSFDGDEPGIDETDVNSGEPTGGSNETAVLDGVDRVTNDYVIGAHSTGEGPVPIPNSGDSEALNPVTEVPPPDSGDSETLTSDVDDDMNDTTNASYNHRWGHRHGSDHYNLRPRRDPAYHAKHLTQWSRYGVATAELIKTELGTPSIVESYNMMQMRVPEAIRRHGDKAIQAIYREVQQLEDMSALNPVHHCRGDL